MPVSFHFLLGRIDTRILPQRAVMKKPQDSPIESPRYKGLTCGKLSINVPSLHGDVIDAASQGF
jgi:hypothetical protein